MNASIRIDNPFLVTKANDFSDDEIQEFWVETPRRGSEIGDLVRPKSAVPMFILGGKGSGKTHLMRYHSYQLQRLRFQKAGTSLLDGIRSDGYLGIYLLCSGLNAGRFAGKGQDPELWKELFAYYIELWVAHQLVVTLEEPLTELAYVTPQLCADIIDLFDSFPTRTVNSWPQLAGVLAQQIKHLDLQINNCVLTGKLEAEILATRGKLIFGIPRVLSMAIEELGRVSFVYAIDELENLSSSQQRLINSLVRDRVLPSTFRIGARRYGIKTLRADASQEENLPDSEFEQIVLDDEFRSAKREYFRFSRQLLVKRFRSLDFRGKATAKDLANSFESLNERWDSELYLEMVHGVPSPERRHFRFLRDKLDRAGVPHVEEIVEILSVMAHPLLEKVNILLLYGALRIRRDAVQEAKQIALECDEFLFGHGRVRMRNRVKRVLGHYQSDLIAQLRRENRAKHLYLGLDNFIAMSGGLPRALLTTLRNVFDWSSYNGEDPLARGGISIEAQRRGVNKSSDWFFNNIRTAGADGVLIQSATDRLAQIFKTNRFADRPVECSLNSFSIAEHNLNDDTRRILRLCENRSLLNRVIGGQKHRNTERIEMKFQLHPMLCPRWQLPLGRRGALALSPQAADIIFDVDRDEEFEEFLRDFRVSRTFGDVGSLEQETLF